MKTFIPITILALTISLLNCSGQTDNHQLNTSKQDTITVNEKSKKLDNPKDLVKNYNGENNKLFVFVGQKLSVDPLPYKEGLMDGGFKAKYLILQKVYGDFSNDTIEFVAYDHYGIPPFSKFENVLLFVSFHSGLYYHQKYMYNDVYQTKEGKWAGTYAENDYGHEYNKQTKVKPIKIDFSNEVSYPTKIVRSDSQIVTITYPKPYFKTVGDKAIAIYGNYVDELFVLKRDGYLTARGIFEPKHKKD